MAKSFTKADKLATVESKEKYCVLIENVITNIEKTLEVKKSGTNNIDGQLAISKLEMELFERKSQLKVCKEIAEDFRSEYENVFLPEYERRIESCYKNFDEDYKYIKEHINQIPISNPLYVAVVSYEKENPDNESEELMLLFFEKIRPAVGIMKEGEKKGSHLKKV